MWPIFSHTQARTNLATEVTWPEGWPHNSVTCSLQVYSVPSSKRVLFWMTTACTKRRHTFGLKLRKHKCIHRKNKADLKSSVSWTFRSVPLSAHGEILGFVDCESENTKVSVIVCCRHMEEIYQKYRREVRALFLGRGQSNIFRFQCEPQALD